MDSNSSEENSSDYSTESSDESSDEVETAQINGVKLQLPQGLCERKDVFKEFFSNNLWDSLSDSSKQHLQTFLPNFPVNDEQEKAKTLQRLFNFDNFRFNNPLEKFHDNLKAGYFRPDIARLRRIIKKAERKEAIYRYKTFKTELQQDVIESQNRLLNQIRNLPPGVEPKPEKRRPSSDYISHRTKRRYFQVLASIRSKTDDVGCSSDENYPEGPPIVLSRKQKRHLNTIKSTLSNGKEKMITSTMCPRLHSVNLEKFITPNHNPFYLNEEAYHNLLSSHKRRKLESPDDPELNTKGISLSDVVNRTQLPYIKNLPVAIKQNDSKMKKKVNKKEASWIEKKSFLHEGSDSDSDSFEASINSKPKIAKKPTSVPPQPKVVEVKQEEPKPVTPPLTEPKLSNSPMPMTPINSLSQYGKIAPVKVEDLERIDMMNLPIDLDNSDIDILSEFTSKPELMQETHANFFSLIRDVICSTNDHRMNMYNLQERLKAWQENPISPLNDWYSLTDNWIGLLPSAITFLCGNSSEQPDDFVPYMEYKTQVDMYQWIGAGRDSDGLLSLLCQFWLDHRTETKMSPFKEKEEFNIDIIDRSQTPPPPRFPTNWTVRKATPEEIKDFQEQERKRYDNPHKAFTYRCNGYESVVGPLKGIYNAAVGSTKARGHTMLNADRPNFVTILSLVRDATARLPNGEGTRAEICELLKSSQYISNSAADNILQSVVSGALDRMHTQFDPCVKYDQKRKIWIYLHRNRSEEDFERIHQQYQGMNKVKKPTSKKSPAKAKPRIEKPVKITKEQPVADKVKVIKKPVQNKVNPAPPIVVAQKATSVLLSNNVAAENDAVAQAVESIKPSVPVRVKQIQEEKEDAIQTIRVASPTLKSKGLVKILSPSQGKSLIIPSGNQQIIKQVQADSSKSQHVVTQHFIQNVGGQKQPIIVQKAKSSVAEEKPTEAKIKVPVSVQQQIIQSITPQQLQSLKNFTLLRQQSAQNVNLSPISMQNSEGQNNIVTVAVSKGNASQLYGQGIQIKTQGNLSQAQQQQIIQTLRQKIIPHGGTVLQQPVLYKQKNIKVLQTQASAVSAPVLTSQKVASDAKTATSSQGPVVAKVLTNAAGQVISVESLLAHQKQHGTLPQGTTLRVAGGKSGHQNVIHLTGTKQNSLAQFAVATQNNLIAITTQPKLVVASQSAVTSTVTASKPITKTVTKTQPVTKFSPRSGQHLINAKIITSNVDGAKIVQPKIVMSQQGAVKLASAKNATLTKPVTLNVPASANTLRMVNSSNLNIAHISGKPVLLANKGSTIQNIQGQNVILQAQPNTSGTLVLQQNTVKNAGSGVAQSSTGTNINIINQQNIVLGQTMKMQQQPQVVLGSGVKNTISSQQNASQGHIMLGGHPVRLQTSNASNTQRVVLASQGQGGQIVAQQILLPAGFQGTAINLKALQGVKVIPIAQGQTKSVQGRQVFARVMSPNIVRSNSQTGTVQDKSNADAGVSSSD